MKKPRETRGKKADLWADDKAVAMVLEGASIKEAAEASDRSFAILCPCYNEQQRGRAAISTGRGWR